MAPLYQRFIEADLVVLASPVYWWSISAQLKLFIDRLYGLNFEQHPEYYKGKKLVLVFTHQEEHPCAGAELARKMFDEIAEYTEMTIAGDLRYSSDQKHVREAPEKLREARELGAPGQGRLKRAGTTSPRVLSAALSRRTAATATSAARSSSSQTHSGSTYAAGSAWAGASDRPPESAALRNCTVRGQAFCAARRLAPSRASCWRRKACPAPS